MNHDLKTLRALGERIRHVRKLRGVTQASVARDAGLDVQYYNRLERGKVNPTFITMSKVAKGLGIEPCPGFLYLGALNAPVELAAICSCSAKLMQAGRKKELRQTRDFLEHVLGARCHEAQGSCVGFAAAKCDEEHEKKKPRKERRKPKP
ncbi:MAG: helix-turn-helix domain-containing protein [Candidatus Hydrogenedentota bacterium]